MELLRDAADWGDRNFVLRAIREDGRELQYATEELRGDRDVVMEAVRQNGRALEYAAEELRGDRDL
eukprot:3118493-Amphidinium_carterae.1